MGVRDCFGRLFGPDLIDTHKAGPEFYACLLADAGVAPEAALVVDDNPMVLRWATQVGAKTVLVGAAATQGGRYTTLPAARIVNWGPTR